MRKFYGALLAAFLLIAGVQPSVLAQADTLPLMHVDSARGNALIKEFSAGARSKSQVFKELNSRQDFSFIYSIKAVDSLIRIMRKTPDGMRVHFARYIKRTCDSDKLPANTKDSTVLLLFALEVKGGRGPDRYYFINGNGVDNIVYEVPKQCAEAWIDNYQSREVQDRLLETVVPNDPDNIYPPESQNYSDTRSIFYRFKNLEEAFTREQRLKHILKSNGKEIKISAYRVIFSAYPMDGTDNTEPDVDEGHNKKRLLILFDYMYKNNGRNTVFNLEDLTGFEARPRRIKPVNKFKEDKRIKKIDNGQLCPTYCP